MNGRNRTAAVFLSSVVLAALASCGGGTSGTSTLNLGITDAPISGATTVWIQFTGVELKPTDGNSVTFNFSPAKGFDLLALAGGQTAAFLNGATIPAGHYDWVRLMVDPTPGASYVIDATGQHNLTIPSGAETGLKLIQGFTMPQGGVANFTVDFVLSRSIIAPPGQAPDYMLKPVLRLVDNAQVGTIAGTFQPTTLANQSNCGLHAPVVYVFAGSAVVPDDIYVPDSGTPPAVQPLVTATAALDMNSAWSYSIAFLPVGTYTVAFTCDPDDPAVNETVLMPPTLSFMVYPQDVAVTANMTSTADF